MKPYILILTILIQCVYGGEILIPSFSSGNPMYEIEADLMQAKALRVASPISYTDKLEKGEAYLLPSKKIVYIVSVSKQYGDGYKFKRMAIFDADKIKNIPQKDLVYFFAFDLKKEVGFNP